jgi:phospholipase/carboxylesterase
MSQFRQSAKLLHQPPAQSNFGVESGLFSVCPRDTVHAIFAPLKYEPRYSYPLIVWLHGPANDERQLLRIMPLISMRNYVAVAPRGPLLVAAEAHVPESYGWRQSEEIVQRAEQRIFDCIEAAGQKYHFAPNRIFIAGFDCGGTMAFRVAMNHPERFAGVLSLGGPFPTERTPLANLPEARQLPVFLAGGRRSPLYGEAEVCNDLRLLHTAGLSITLRLYPCGHELSPQMLADVDRWIIAQITSSEPAIESDHEWSREVDG